MRKQPANFARTVALALPCAVFAAAPPARAQTPAQAPPPSRTEPAPTPGTRTPDAAPASRQAAPTDAAADLSITARVTARELLFRKVPNPRVEFFGDPERRTVWEADRENLPPQVRPGETYRDIGITLRITSVFADIDRIVAEALGEVPSTDDAPPPQPAPRQDETPADAARQRGAPAPPRPATTAPPQRARGGNRR